MGTCVNPKAPERPRMRFRGVAGSVSPTSAPWAVRALETATSDGGRGHASCVKAKCVLKMLAERPNLLLARLEYPIR